MVVRVLGNKVLVEVSRAIKTESGIILPVEEEREDKKPIIAEVLAVGDEVEDLKIGDKVLINKFCGKTISQDSESTYTRLIDFNDVLALITD